MRNKVISTIIAIILVGLLIWLGYIIYKRNKDAKERDQAAQELQGPILGQIDDGAVMDDRTGNGSRTGTSTTTTGGSSNELGTNNNRSSASIRSSSSSSSNTTMRVTTRPSSSRILVNVDGVRLNIPRNFQYKDEGDMVYLFDATGKNIGIIQVIANLFNKETLETQEDTLNHSTVSSKSRGTLAGKRALIYKNSGTKSAIITTKTNIYYISGSLADPTTKYLNKVN